MVHGNNSDLEKRIKQEGPIRSRILLRLAAVFAQVLLLDRRAGFVQIALSATTGHDDTSNAHHSGDANDYAQGGHSKSFKTAVSACS